MKADILAFVESVRARMPAAAEYLEKHLVFDDEKETVMYTGGDRFKLVPLNDEARAWYEWIKNH